MNANEIHMPGWRPILVLAFILCLTGFGGRALFAASPAPQVKFDQTAIPPDVPPQVLIGEDFTFRVRFRNVFSSTAIPGYGPFIDVVLDAGGANLPKPPQTQPCACDGLTFVQANMVAVNGGPVPLVTHQSLAPCVPLPANVALNHPFAGVLPVLVPAGSQLITLELPFGSFDPTQPEVIVEVTAHVSKLADANVPLKIRARGGFRYGADPLDDAPPDWPVVSDVIAATPPADQQADSTLWAAQAQTAPTVLTVSKDYLGPENETATGPNFIRRYQITLDVASGQTVNNVKVTDHLPNNVAFHQISSVSSSPPCSLTVTTSPVPNVAHNSPNNDLILQCSSITGSPGPDATIVFEFFIPELDGNNNPVLSPGSCAFVQSINDIKGEGSWLPVDPCDITPVNVVSDVTPADHTLLDKCLAIQKTVVDLNGAFPAHPIPGDTLQYRLDFQLSDFKTAGKLKVQDVFSDGQTFVNNSLTLTVTDQCGTTSGSIPLAAFTKTTLSCGAGAPPPRTQLDIDVSAAMTVLAASSGPPRHQNGILTGGYAFAPSTTSTVPATGSIIFKTVIDDAYQCPVPSPHDVFVDKDDPLDNRVTLTADILAKGGICSTIPGSAGFTAQDDSKVAILIATDFLEKTIYAVIRGSAQICGPNTAPCPSKPQVVAGDQVVFRLRKTIPSADAENLTIRDWLPLPSFLAAGGGFSNIQCGLPSVGNSCLGPANTLSVAPIYTADGTTNSIKFDYLSFNSPLNLPRAIDLLFTRVVTNTPFADGLYVTNEAQECESNTFGVTFCQTAIAQVQVREPALKISKGLVAANNPNAVFSPSPAGPVTFHALATSCPRFNGTITSTGLASAPVNSDISGVDANDCVTFAIVVENTGGAPAYDIKLREIFPLGPADGPECFAPDFSSNSLCVTDGAGTPIPFTLGIGRSLPIVLQNPLPGRNSSGSNIAIITFDACILSDIKPHCCGNTSTLENYASTPGGPNFVDAGFGGPFKDSAQICVLPKATKSIRTTSEAHTPGTPSASPLSPEKLAIGEIIRYRLEVVVPETTSPSTYKLEDFLPSGLSYLPGFTTTVTLSPGLLVSNFLPLVSAPPSCNGGSLTFDFGNVVNNNNTPAQELIVLEFNALVCNVASNQNATALNNSFAVLVDGQQVAASNTVAATVVEPNITIVKSGAVPSLIAAATATYTITLTNNGTATAFDVRLTDQLPACLANLANIQVSTTFTNNSAGTLMDLTIASIPVNGTVTVHYTATVGCIDCNKLINTARVAWTSLPGPLGTTVNPTGSATPGASGLLNGERNDAGGVDDYVASSTTTLCCMLVSNDTVHCNPNGSFTYTFTVTNFSTSPVGVVLITAPTGVTVTPNSMSIPPLLPGASTTVTVTLSGPAAVSGANICLSVALALVVVNCRIDQCITLPKCCVAPPSGMVAWWTLDEAQGSVVADIAGNVINNNGTTTPGPINAGGPNSTLAEVNGGLSFCASPTPSFVTVPDNTALNFGTTQSFSIDAWIKTSSTSQFQMIVDKLNWPNPTAGYRFYVDNQNRLKFDIGPGAAVVTSSGTALTLGNWHHVAVTVNRPNQQVTFYVDGVPEVFSRDTSPFNASNAGLTLLIGGTHETQLVPLEGCRFVLDEVEIFNRVLTAGEVQGMANAGVAGKCRPGCLPRPADLLDWWTFDEITGTTAQDIGGFVNNAGKYVGSPQPVAGLIGAALQFDGSHDYVLVPNQGEVNFPGCGNLNATMPLTIDVWVHVNIPPGTSAISGLLTILDKRGTPSNPRGYHLFIFNGRAGFQINGANYVAPASGPDFIDVADGQWHFIAVSLSICRGSGGFLFVDGKNVAVLPGANDLDNTADLYIGARNPAFTTNFFNGALDELEIFSRALTEAELRVLFDARSRGKCKADCASKTMTISPAILPPLFEGINFSLGAPLTVTGGIAPYSFAVTGGQLPPGMFLGSDGQLLGRAPAASTYDFTITAMDADGCRVQRDYHVTIFRIGRRHGVGHT